ncbi:MAG: alginate lyase family protein, partial [Burkholderiales bacterium]
RSLADRIRTDFPEAPTHASARADAILNGEYDLLGYTRVAIGRHPRWHLDTIHDRQPPRIFWADVPYLDPAFGDHKIIWELNRHQHWLALGRAHALCGEARYYDAFTRQLASWLAENPPLIGVNWASMLELGFRVMSWLWALELFAPAAGAADDEPWLVDLLLGIDRQLTHIEHNLSYYFSPNTHLTGEALALYVAGTSLPELRASARRAALGRDVLLREATRQVRADGGHAELSGHYHRYSTDFYLLAAVVAGLAQDPSAPAFEQAARAQARFLRVIADDTGRRPQIGDDDGGQLSGMCGRDPADCRDTLATAAVLLHDPSLAIGPTPEETYWLCGPPPGAAEQASTTWPSTALASSGYFVSRTPRGDHLVFDAGPHGFLNGGHAHGDALACTIVVAGRPLLIDPGTGTYTMDAGARDRFRSSLMHNTVALDGRPQSETAGPFHWKTTVNARAPIWQSSNGCDYVEGTHDAYAPRRHTRAILAIHGVGWWIVDHVLGSGTTAIENYWHLAPAWRCSIGAPHVCRLEDADRTLALASSSPLSLLAPGADPLAVRSPAYGVIEPAPVVRASAVAPLPATVATFIPASREYTADLSLESVAVTSAPGSGWHGRAFALRWNGSAMTVLTAVELSGIAERETSAPSNQWGTAELRTDARLALVIDRTPGPSEAIVVSGATVTAARADRLVALARRVPLLRLTMAPVAPRMHEVGAGIQP